MEQLQEILIGGIPIAVLIGLTVQALKVYGFVGSENSPKAAISISLVFGVLGIAGEINPELQPYLVLVVKYLAGAVVAGLGYEYIAARALEKAGIPIRSKSLKKRS